MLRICLGGKVTQKFNYYVIVIYYSVVIAYIYANVAILPFRICCAMLWLGCL